MQFVSWIFHTISISRRASSASDRRSRRKVRELFLSFTLNVQGSYISGMISYVYKFCRVLNQMGLWLEGREGNSPEQQPLVSLSSSELRFVCWYLCCGDCDLLCASVSFCLLIWGNQDHIICSIIFISNLHSSFKVT